MNTGESVQVNVPGALWVLVGVAVLLLVWTLVRPHTDTTTPTEPTEELPRRRRPIDEASREARRAQLDAVLAECYRSPTYLGVRLAEYEGEISFLAELALEIDENTTLDGEEGDHAHL